MSKPVPESKSSLELLKECEYKFGQVYLLGKRGPSNDAAQAGTIVHKRLEDWRLTGAIPDRGEKWKVYKIGEIAHAMIALLPPFGTPGIKTESDKTTTVDGYLVRTIMDWTREPDLLGDYKTTSNIEADHVLNVTTIRRDIQANLSARVLDCDLTLDWTYGQSKGKAIAKKVSLRVLRSEVKQQFQDYVEPLIVRAQTIRQKNDPESLARNNKVCKKYGTPCHLYDECWTDGQKLRLIMSSQTIAEKLRAKGLMKSEPANEVKEPEPKPLFGVEGGFVASEPEPDPINPPITTGTPPAPEVVSTEPAKKPRGRKKEFTTPVREKDHTLTNPEALFVAEETAEPGPKTVSMADATGELTDPSKPIRTLYVNCLPMFSANLVYAHTLIAQAAATVCNDLQTQHVKLIDFGKGGGSLAAQLAADILELPAGFDMVLLSKTPEGRDVESTLCGLAQQVIMGV